MTNETMHAWRITSPGPQGALTWSELPVPLPGPGELLVRVAYAGLNRADLFQVAGQYPAPEETAMVPGLEISGEVAALGEGVAGFAVGGKVCALLQGGGYAEYCLVPAGQALPLPAGMTLAEAAALPEGLATGWLALARLAGLQAGERVLIHGGSSGIGTLAIPLARCLGARVFATAHGQEKMALCTALGAETVDYKQDVTAVMREATAGQGVDVVLDMLGGTHIDEALGLLAYGGRLISIAFLQGSRVEVNAGRLLMKNLRWMGMTLRSRSVEEKAAILSELHRRLWPEVEAGRLRPTLDRVFAFADAQKAQARMQQRLHIGKILLEVGP